ncbi:hypothetical protein [Streptomyces sp. enrichment culture]|uniref:hypothetical protein n=1 Tax=Streptomyces sp. enrichment culture TaxID=1795815 RepID=UPI003F5791E5
MRTRVTVAAVSGALALSALAVPAAQAGEGKPYPLDISFSRVTVNSGLPIAVDHNVTRHVRVSYTLTHGADVDLDDPDLYHRIDLRRTATTSDGTADWLPGDMTVSTCTETSATTADCTGVIPIVPTAQLSNADATTWSVSGYAIDYNGHSDPELPVPWEKVGVAEQPGLGTAKIQRVARLTANAAPEPVRKGRTITVTGKLTRVNWDTDSSTGVANQYVKLLYKKAGATSWVTLKTTKSSSTGALSTTTTATYDGYYRFSYAGATTTSAALSNADFVDVQ